MNSTIHRAGGIFHRGGFDKCLLRKQIFKGLVESIEYIAMTEDAEEN